MNKHEYRKLGVNHPRPRGGPGLKLIGQRRFLSQVSRTGPLVLVRYYKYAGTWFAGTMTSGTRLCMNSDDFFHRPQELDHCCSSAFINILVQSNLA